MRLRRKLQHEAERQIKPGGDAVNPPTEGIEPALPAPLAGTDRAAAMVVDLIAEQDPGASTSTSTSTSTRTRTRTRTRTSISGSCGSVFSA
jgi:hypothetical protein